MATGDNDVWAGVDLTHAPQAAHTMRDQHYQRIYDANKPDTIMAGIAREQYEDYLQDYEPIERAHFDKLTSTEDLESKVDDAGARAKTAQDVATGITDRDIERYAINVTPAQKAHIDKMRRLGVVTNTIDSRNRARTGYGDERLRALNVASGYSRGLARSATDLQGHVSSMATSRDNFNRSASANYQAQQRQYSAQQDASRNQTVMAGIGMAMMMFSSEKYKENIRPANKEKLHDEVMTMGLKRYDYKDDAPASGKNIDGQIVEETNSRYTQGDMLDLNKVLTSVVASQQVLGKQVEGLKREVSKNG